MSFVVNLDWFFEKLVRMPILRSMGRDATLDRGSSAMARQLMRSTKKRPIKHVDKFDLAAIEELVRVSEHEPTRSLARLVAALCSGEMVDGREIQALTGRFNTTREETCAWHAWVLAHRLGLCSDCAGKVVKS